LTDTAIFFASGVNGLPRRESILTPPPIMLTLQDNGESNRYWADQSSIISYAKYYKFSLRLFIGFPYIELLFASG